MAIACPAIANAVAGDRVEGMNALSAAQPSPAFLPQGPALARAKMP
ncbi:MAG: hypothetical protein Q8P67_27860 [archaeon]|nr:hypothetical protein [archaeon]